MDLGTRREASSGRWIFLIPVLLLAVPAVIVHGADGKTNSPASSVRAAKQAVGMPLFVNNIEKGELLVVAAQNAPDVLIEGEPLIHELESMLQPAIVGRMRGAIDAAGFIRFQALQQIGFKAEFDPRELQVKVDVPPELRKASSTTVYPRRPPFDPAKAIKPSLFSTYLNIRSGFDYVEQSTTGLNEGLQPMRLDLEGAVNLNNWVVEGSAIFTDQPVEPWDRGDLRLVRDDPDRSLRYTLGDLNYPINGFQTFGPMAGFGISKNFTLQPYRVTEPLGQTSFFLKSPSRVEVYVNGRFVQTLQMAPGPHTLKDFFLVNGSNDVMLRITDDVGHVETLHLSFFYDSRLLAQGEQEFSYNVGVPSTLDAGGRTYDEERPSISLFHRFGVSDTFNIGYNFQGNELFQSGGADALLTTKLGTFQSDASLSHTRDGHVDGAARIQYIYTDAAATRVSGSVFSLGLQYTGRSFATLGNPDPENPVGFDLSARYSLRLPWNMRAGIGGDYQFRRAGQTDSTSASIFLSRRWKHGITTDLTLDRDVDQQGVQAYRAFVTFSWFFESTGNNINGSYDSYTQTGRLDWQYNPRYSVGGLGGGLGVQETPETQSGFGHLHYTGYRGEMDLSQNVTTPTRPNDQIDTRSSLRVGTALVYADGEFGVSRPITDSFAIVVPHESLAGKTIGIDPSEQHYGARVDRFGPGIIPSLQPYQVRRVLIDAEDLPAEYQVTEDSIIVRPAYKSGTIIRVGSEPTVIARGVLTFADGSPVPLQAGEVVPVSDKSRKTITFFTNRQGRFSLDGLAPGAYEIHMLANAASVIRFEIPKNKLGFYDIGSLKLPAETGTDLNAPKK